MWKCAPSACSPCKALAISEFERIYRSESAAVTARLIRTLGGDFALAEEVVQEAFAAALEQWPAQGTPQHPRAWLLQTAQHKAIDRLRRSRRLGKFEPAVPDYERSLELAKNEAERRYLSRRLHEMHGRIGNRRDT